MRAHTKDMVHILSWSRTEGAEFGENGERVINVIVRRHPTPPHLPNKENDFWMPRTLLDPIPILGTRMVIHEIESNFGAERIMFCPYGVSWVQVVIECHSSNFINDCVQGRLKEIMWMSLSLMWLSVNSDSWGRRGPWIKYLRFEPNSQLLYHILMASHFPLSKQDYFCRNPNPLLYYSKYGNPFWN